jgi:methylmalonic aciduria homocystinuria type C protein
MLVQLADAGFDIVHPFDAARLARELELGALDDPARPVGLLIGNTRALWPRFVAALRGDPALAADEHPLDRYTERAIERAAPAAPRWFAHRRYDGAFLPMQRLAVAAGLGGLAKTGLVIHPVYGPWLALRAVLLVDGELPVSRPAIVPCTCDTSCEVALARARLADGPAAWRAWLAVRDACTIGREYRYSDEQIEYHYTKQKCLLG